MNTVKLSDDRFALQISTDDLNRFGLARFLDETVMDNYLNLFSF